jgi:7-cyano-7-deazaguanine synthase
MEKADIVRLGDRLGVPFGETWSCYKGGDVHCGVCSSCRERKRAFLDAGVSDPTGYER